MKAKVRSGNGLTTLMLRPPRLSQRLSVGSRMATPLNVKPIGEGAAELRIDRGPGYRIYFGWDGKVLVILLGGGTKRRQRSDIEAALRHWRDYKRRKADNRKG
jgi:putative addiction module killer protein